MCGIAGVFHFGDQSPPERLVAAAMLSALTHRGPDTNGAYRDSSILLAHSRLSIIDIHSGDQPLCNETSNMWIVFNGEIFNYLELRKDLEHRGHVFATKSDTEVIVHAYEEWGSEAFSRFNGQWSLALWDASLNELVLARDPLGICPLYYCRYQHRLYFASEIGAIFAANPDIPRSIDPVGLSEVFTFWAPIGKQTTFSNIYQVKPSEVLLVSKNGGMASTSVNSINFSQQSDVQLPSPEDAARMVGDALRDSIGLRLLRSDVPVGCYLSGGLDSSLLTSIACQLAPKKVCTYSIRFSETHFDEGKFQQMVVGQYGTDHNEIVINQSDVSNVFPDVIRRCEQPILRTSPAPLFLLSKAVFGNNMKVVLSGEGSDEIFGGYDIFKEAKIRRFWARCPDSRLRPSLFKKLYLSEARSPVALGEMTNEFFGHALADVLKPGFAHGPRWKATMAIQRFFNPETREASREVNVLSRLLTSLPDCFSGWQPLAQDQFIEIQTILSGFLLSSQGDRMLMSHSVEGRFPFLDSKLISMMSTMPDIYKIKGLCEKYLLKRVAKGIVPSDIIKRTKQPYKAPEAACFLEGKKNDYLDVIFSSDSIKESSLFDVTNVQRLIKKLEGHSSPVKSSNNDNMAFIAILSTQLLYFTFIRPMPTRASCKIHRWIERVHYYT